MLFDDKYAVGDVSANAPACLDHDLVGAQSAFGASRHDDLLGVEVSLDAAAFNDADGPARVDFAFEAAVDQNVGFGLDQSFDSVLVADDGWGAVSAGCFFSCE